MESPQRPRRPPVDILEQAHHGRDDEHPHHCRVDHHRSRQADADRLDQQHLGEAEGEEDDDHDPRRAGDDPATPRQPFGHREQVVAGPLVDLLDPRQQHHLVVHREAEDDAEHQHRQGRVDRLRREVEQ